MSFDTVKEAVLTEARSDAAAILREAESNVADRLASLRAENAAFLEDSIRQAEAAAIRENARQVGLARHEGRLAVLAAKNAVIDEVFRKVAEGIAALSDQEYTTLAQQWLEALSPEIGGTIKAGPRLANLLTASVLETLNRKRGAIALAFSHVETDATAGLGLLVEGDTFTIDLRIETKLAEIREAHAGDIAKELFGS